MNLRYRHLDKKLSAPALADSDTDFQYDVLPGIASITAGVAVMLYSCLFWVGGRARGFEEWLGVLIAIFIDAIGGMFFLWLPIAIGLQISKSRPVKAVAIRKFYEGSETSLSPMEAEYCRTVAVPMEQDRLPDETGREVIVVLNLLLQGSSRLDEQLKELQGVLTAADAPTLNAEAERLQAALEKEIDPARQMTLEQLLRLNQTRQNDEAALDQNAEHLKLRQETIRQTFVSLRGTLLRTRLAQQHITDNDVLRTTSAATGSVQFMQELVTQLQQVRSVELATDELLAVSNT